MALLCCFGGGHRPSVDGTTSSPGPDTEPRTVDAGAIPFSCEEGHVQTNAAEERSSQGLLSLLPLLPAISRGGWWERLHEACGLVQEHMSAAHCSIFVVDTEEHATPTVWSGLQPEALRGAAFEGLARMGSSSQASGPQHSGVASARCSAADEASTCGEWVLWRLKEHSNSNLVVRSMPVPKAPGKDSRKGVGASALSRSACKDMPRDWQQLWLCHGCRHFAAVPVRMAGQVVGVLSLAAEGTTPPKSWTSDALKGVAALLMVHLVPPQVRLTAVAIAELSCSETLGEAVRVVNEVSRELLLVATRVDAAPRLAFIAEDAAAAAIFAYTAGNGPGSAAAASTGGTAANRKPHDRRRSSDVMLMMERPQGPLSLPPSATGMSGANAAAGAGASPSGPGSAGARRISAYDSNGGSAKTASFLRVGAQDLTLLSNAAHADLQEEPSHPLLEGSGTPRFGRRSIELPSFKGTGSHGHALRLSETLLQKALDNGAAGLCIADCNDFVKDAKAYPRDLVLSRDTLPPQSLALVTRGHEGRPLLALYATYATVLPQGVLQSVVQELSQLLEALSPVLLSKLLRGSLADEFHELMEQLKELATGKKRAPEELGACAGGVPACLGGNGDPSASGADRSPFRTASACPAAPSAAAAAACSAATDSAASHAVGGMRSALANLGRVGSARSQLTTDDDAPARRGGTSDLEDSLSGPGSGRRALSYSHHALKSQPPQRAPSFTLSAARAPQGAAKLLPVMSNLSNRLKEAQAHKLVSHYAKDNAEELSSLKMLRVLGQGGYGTVYAGTYHNAEVAVKVIHEAALAPPPDPASAGFTCPNRTALSKQQVHDAIELVASSSFNHPNCVQVLAYFLDCRLECAPLPTGGERVQVAPAGSGRRRERHAEDGGGAGGGDASRPAELRVTRLPSRMLESPSPGEDLPCDEPGCTVMVLEFCDKGTLFDAINERVFFRRVEADKVGPILVDGAAQVPPRDTHFLKLDMKAVYATLLEVALALRHMHSLHVVHCDLKPQNVLLKSNPRDPRGFTVKLSDFGLSKVMAKDDDGRMVIDEQVGSGTLTHVAPEVFAGRVATESVDIYAFGIMMFQVLCGVEVYPPELAPAQMVQQVVKHGLRPQLLPWVPRGFRELAQRCWHAVPSARPTAEELVRTLERMLTSGGGRTPLDKCCSTGRLQPQPPAGGHSPLGGRVAVARAPSLLRPTSQAPA